MSSRRTRPYRTVPLEQRSSFEASYSGSASDDSEDEEKTVGSRHTARSRRLHAGESEMRSLDTRSGRPRWTMRSRGKGNAASNAASGTDSSAPSDEGGGGKASVGGGGSSKVGHPDSDAETSEGESDRDDRPSGKERKAGRSDTDGEDQAVEEQQKIHTLYWVAGGIAILVVILLVGGIYWWTHRDSSDGDSSSAASSVTSASPVTSATTQAIATIASVTPVLESSAVPATTSVEAGSTSAAGATNQTSQVVTSAQPSATATSSAIEAGTTYPAQIKWFYAEDQPTECGTEPNDGDYVVKVSPDVYGPTTEVSSVCGTWVTLYQLEKDSYARATVEGLCSDCTGYNLILSQATFNALTQDMDLGTTLAQFWLTDEDHQPKRTLSSAVAAAAGSTTRATKATSSQSGKSAQMESSSTGLTASRSVESS